MPLVSSTPVVTSDVDLASVGIKRAYYWSTVIDGEITVTDSQVRADNGKMVGKITERDWIYSARLELERSGGPPTESVEVDLMHEGMPV